MTSYKLKRSKVPRAALEAGLSMSSGHGSGSNHTIDSKIEGRKRQQMLELEKMRMDFQRELELQKKVILERAQAEIAKVREEEDEDANSVENLSG
ncbi:trihelix protein [Artemisia annua]|uniref:Trihelix protein n=1 Tax=Artemisia annua TaxID=35608 RepID=A0A2U1NXU4_ARTAN|nr:trihelix protein [Artemisia annua]